ncbi:MAG: deoxyribonuclease IV [Thermotogota bacterium]|nr:deoxyribonuclease IV [Thermotogota bacterium]
MIYLGCHLSISDGFYKTAKVAFSIGANTFQYFTRNPRGGRAKEIDKEDVNKAKDFMAEKGFGILLAHASYTMNLCSNKEQTRQFAKDLLLDDLERLKQLPESLYVFHPGSHVGQGVEKGIRFIIEALNEAIKVNQNQFILLEGMSGKGTEIGSRFEELKLIIQGVKENSKLGICLDTCHLYSAGYDVVKNLDGVLEEFDNVIGIERLKAMHVNDSKMPFDSHKDRHEIIGKGELGLDAIVNVINHPKLKRLPFSLETPGEPEDHAKEIRKLKES